MNIELELSQAQELSNKGKDSHALRIYKRLSLKSDDPRVFISMGYCLQRLKHWKRSISVFKKAIKLKPAYCLPDTHLALGCSYIKNGQKKQAIEQWKICKKWPPEYPSYDNVPQMAKEYLAKYA